MENSIEQLTKEVTKLQDAIKLAPISTASVTQPWSQELVQFLIASILVFGLLVLIVMAVLFIKGKDADQILRMCALPMIIVAAIFLVVTGFSNDQISPVMGLLGAIAGYLLGSKRTGDSVPPRSDPPNGKS